MKNFNSSLVIVLAVSLLSCSSNTKEKPPAVQTQAVNTPGVLCGGCEKTVEEAVTKLEGIEEVKVDVEAKTTTVKFFSDKVNLQAIESQIAHAGYDANTTKRNQAAYEKLDACCRVDG